MPSTVIIHQETTSTKQENGINIKQALSAKLKMKWFSIFDNQHNIKTRKYFLFKLERQDIFILYTYNLLTKNCFSASCCFFLLNQIQVNLRSSLKEAH